MVTARAFVRLGPLGYVRVLCEPNRCRVERATGAQGLTPWVPGSPADPVTREALLVAMERRCELWPYLDVCRLFEERGLSTIEYRPPEAPGAAA